MADRGVFECGLCRERYDENVHRPLSLPCGHVFCEECLRRRMLSEALQCPIDHTRINVLLKDIPCCYTIFVNLPKARSKEACSPTQHRKKVKFLCTVHEAYLCSECIITHTGSGHFVEAFSNLAQKLKTQIEDLTQEIQRRVPTLVETKNSMETNEKKLAGFYESQRMKINTVYDEVMNSLIAKRKELVKELKSHWMKQARICEEERHRVNAGIDSAKETLLKLQQALLSLGKGRIEDVRKVVETSQLDVRRLEEIKTGEVSVYGFQEALRVSDKSAVMRLKSLDSLGSRSKESFRIPTRAFALDSHKKDAWTCKRCFSHIDSALASCPRCIGTGKEQDFSASSGVFGQSPKHGKNAGFEETERKEMGTGRKHEKVLTDVQTTRNHYDSPRSTSKPAAEKCNEKCDLKSPPDTQITRRRLEQYRPRFHSRQRSVLKTNNSF